MIPLWGPPSPQYPGVEPIISIPGQGLWPFNGPLMRKGIPPEHSMIGRHAQIHPFVTEMDQLTGWVNLSKPLRWNGPPQPDFAFIGRKRLDDFFLVTQVRYSFPTCFRQDLRVRVKALGRDPVQALILGLGGHPEDPLRGPFVQVHPRRDQLLEMGRG